MNDFSKTLRKLAELCGKSEYQVAQYSGLDPSFVRRLFDGEKQASNLTIVRLALALVMDPEVYENDPAMAAYILNTLKNAQLSDAVAKLT
jgi:transcriptional regulator with XRE-family HTH domain